MKDGAEYICKVVKGEYSLAYDGYTYYTEPDFSKPLVRCKDCAHAIWYANDCDDEGIYKCDKQVYFMVDEKGFCAWGEVKE